MGGDLLWHNTVWASAAEDHARTGRGHGYDFDPMFAAVRPLVQRRRRRALPRGGAVRGAGRAAAELPRLRGAAARSRRGSASFGLGRLHDGLQPQPSTRGSTAWCAPPTCSSAPGVAHVGTFRTAGRAAPAGHPDHRRRRAGRRGRRDVRHSTASRCRRAASGRSRCGTPRTCWPRRAPPAGPAPTSWSCTCTAATSTTTCRTPTRSRSSTRLTRSPDVDLVLGEHAHVVQPITKVNGKWVVYGMGNMVAQQEPARPDTYQGILVRFTFAERRRRPVRGHPGGVRPDRVERLAPRLADPRRAPDRRGRRATVAAVRGGAGSDAGTAPRAERQPTMQAVPTRRKPTPS